MVPSGGHETLGREETGLWGEESGLGEEAVAPDEEECKIL